MKNRNKRLLVNGLLITVSGAIGIYLLRGLWTFILFFISIESSSKDELVENYQQNKTSIMALKEYFNQIVPTGFNVYIEFKDEDHIDLWVYEQEDSKNKVNCLFQQWDINPFDYVMEKSTARDSSKYAPKTKDLEIVKKKLNWTEDTFIEIRNMLDMANCISINNRKPVEIGFARSGMGKYHYNLFDNPIPHEDIKIWNDSCSYIYFKPQVVLRYGGGAFGGQCFPDPD